MRQFAQVCEAVAATTRKNEKVRLVGEYLRSLSVEDAAAAALFFTGRAFPRREAKVTSVGGSLIWEAVAELSGREPAEMQRVYQKYGDLGGMAEELLRGGETAGDDLAVHAVAEAFHELARCRGPLQKRAVLLELFRRARPVEAKYIIKILTGDLRIGLKESLVEMAIARAYERPPQAVSRANMLRVDISAVLRLAAANRLEEASLTLFQPVAFMLASPAATAVEIAEYFPEGALGPSGVLVEDKYDGIRAQAHKRGERVELYSRTLTRITEFPELIPPLAALPGDFVLDGEIVPWRDGRPLFFTDFQKRLGRKKHQMQLWDEEEIPVHFIAFDLLYRDGESLMDRPLSARREMLADLLKPAIAEMVRLIEGRISKMTEEISGAFAAAIARGSEGIMAKALNSPYTPGRRGKFWLKLKRPPATLDVVVTAVEYGHGRRHGVLSDYTFAVRSGEKLLNIGKAYSGLTDAEIQQFTRYFLEHTVMDEGFRRQVEPTVVLEVAFDTIQRSDRHASGYALRFPRILRIRSDKSPADIDTLDSVQQLYNRQRQSEPLS
jgi:DNA ligase-1